MARELVLGIMSGTSLDGVDHVLCRREGGFLRLVDHWHRAFPNRLRTRLMMAAEGSLGAHELAQLHHDLGRFYLHSTQAGRGRHRPGLVGLHGQTVFHQPQAPAPASLQIGEPAYLAEALRAPVVSNFRAGDLAAGGQGAPLATPFHAAAFAQPRRDVCVQNLGGIANVTFLPGRRKRAIPVMAFDTGPANMLLDQAARHYSGGRRKMDRNGAWAGRGHAHPKLLQRWLRHPFLSKAPPKSTGREMFGAGCFKEMLRQMNQAQLGAADALATLTSWTAQAIALNYDLHLPRKPDRVVLCGGGAANLALARALGEAFSARDMRPEVLTSADLGWPIGAVEAAAFAWLACLRMDRCPGHHPAATGARRAVCLGQVTEP